MDTVDIRNGIIPCDTESPYVFISYSSCDQMLVYNDIRTLQQRGYNIWVDVHLDKSKPNWRDDAFKAIENGTCELLIYYVSSSSLVSSPCYDELCTTFSDTAKARRLGNPVKILVIEAEEIGNAVAFTEQLHERVVTNYHDSQGEKDSKCEMLHRIRTQFLNDNNRVRIRAKSTFCNEAAYYEEIERDLVRCQHSVRFTSEKAYRNAIKLIGQGYTDYAVSLLKTAADQYVPAMLMLAHLYRHQDLSIANQWYRKAENFQHSGRWLDCANEYRETKYYSEALAYFLGWGERYSDSEALFRASQVWLGKGCHQQSIQALRAARDLGNKKAQLFYKNVMSASDDDIHKMAYKDESHIH